MTGPSQGIGLFQGPARLLIGPRSAAGASLLRRRLRPAIADLRQQVMDVSNRTSYAVLRQAVLQSVLAGTSSLWCSAQACMAAAVETAWHEGSQHLAGVQQLPERYKVSHDRFVCFLLSTVHGHLNTYAMCLHPFAIHIVRQNGLQWCARTALVTIDIYDCRGSCWISTAASTMGRPRTQAQLRRCGPLPGAA